MTCIISLVRFSKKQSTVETATYGSEFVGARTCVEQIMDLRSTLRYLGVPILGRSFMFGDNESVVNSSSKPDSKLHKRHVVLSFHRVREAVASNMLSFLHIDGVESGVLETDGRRTDDGSATDEKVTWADVVKKTMEVPTPYRKT